MALNSAQQLSPPAYTHALINHQANTGHAQQVGTPPTDLRLARQQETPSNNSPLKHLKIFLLRLVEAVGNWVNKLLGKSQSANTETEIRTLREVKNDLFYDGKIMDSYISATSKLSTDDIGPQGRLFSLMDITSSARGYLATAKESLSAPALTTITKYDEFLAQIDLLQRTTFPGSPHTLTIATDTGHTPAIVRAVDDWYFKVQLLRHQLEEAVEQKLSGLTDQQATHLRSAV